MSKGASTAPLAHSQASLDQRIALYRTQRRLRLFELRANELYVDGLIRGTSHLATGQEAIAAGFAAAMRPDDYTFCTYRGHDHVIARGVSMAAVYGELMGRAGGLMGGKGGSMHLISPGHGALGSYAIVGAHLPIAAGAAWSAQYRGTEQVSVCFFGDGTTNIGAFHEALNTAAVWKLPVIFVCENNQYMEYTPIGSVTAVAHPAADRAAAYGLERILIDGNDVDEVLATAERVIATARAGGGPALVEAETYRHGGHSRADPASYRPAEEVRDWMARDPLPTYRARLVAAGAAEARLDEVDREVAAEIEVAISEATAMAPPNLESVGDDLWADGGSAWRN
ncbi:MAG: thiamine pyrophosphate-dependent dehydrogenase E1 component subunit alpha [Candidatus Limnocylindrales bacterium]